jgi:hypothetical protein
MVIRGLYRFTLPVNNISCRLFQNHIRGFFRDHEVVSLQRLHLACWVFVDGG